MINILKIFVSTSINKQVQRANISVSCQKISTPETLMRATIQWPIIHDTDIYKIYSQNSIPEWSCTLGSTDGFIDSGTVL